MSLAKLFARPESEIDPPADWLENRGTKFYVRSGEHSVVLATPNGPIGAAVEFIGRAIRDSHLSELGDFIDVSESGSFDLADIILRRETSKFLRNKFGIGEELLTSLMIQESANQNED